MISLRVQIFVVNSRKKSATDATGATRMDFSLELLFWFCYRCATKIVSRKYETAGASDDFAKMMLKDNEREKCTNEHVLLSRNHKH